MDVGTCNVYVGVDVDGWNVSDKMLVLCYRDPVLSGEQ